VYRIKKTEKEAKAQRKRDIEPNKEEGGKEQLVE
jgi:hypothetical protein